VQKEKLGWCALQRHFPMKRTVAAKHDRAGGTTPSVVMINKTEATVLWSWRLIYCIEKVI